MGQARSISGKFTEPELPPRTIVKAGGVVVEHYTRGKEHPPAHAHVLGEGMEVRIGANGKRLKGDPPLSPAQESVINDHLPSIRKALAKVRRWWKWHYHLRKN